MNVCIFKGWVQEKPEIKLTTGGKQKVDFQIAVPRKYKSADGKREYDYINLEAWESRADFCARHLNKGSEVVVETELRIDRYTNAEGQKRVRYTFSLTNIEFCSGQAQQTPPANAPQTSPFGQPMTSHNAPQYSPSVGYEEVADDSDLPF